MTAEGKILSRPPRIRVVQIPGEPVVSADAFKALPVADRVRYLANSTESSLLLPFLAADCEVNGTTGAPLEPPSAVFHHYVRLTASGHLGAKIKVAGESLLESGHPQPPKGKRFPAVVLSGRVEDLGGVKDGQPDVMPIELVRLSDTPSDPHFNEYVASPFVLSLGRLNPEQTAFVHLGRLPPLSVRMLDAEGAPIGATIAGELVPTEFGTTTVGGTATLAADDARADDIAAIFICIEVWTGGGGASLLEDPNFGLLDEICEPFPVEVEAAS